MGYSIFLDGILLPVSTEKISVQNSLKSKDYDVLGQGRIQKPEYQDLQAISFSTEFPGRIYSYVEESAWQSPAKLIARLRKLQEEKSPFRFVAAGEDKLTLQVTLEQLDTAEKGGEDGDYEVTIRLKEYREFGVKTTDIPSLPRPGAVPSLPKTVILSPGETLMDKVSKSTSKVFKNSFDVLAKVGEKVTNPVTVPPYQPVKTEIHDADVDFDADREKVRSYRGIAYALSNRLQELWEEKMSDVSQRPPEVG